MSGEMKDGGPAFPQTKTVEQKIDEALAALYGAREVFGDIANISEAISDLESLKMKPGNSTDAMLAERERSDG